MINYDQERGIQVTKDSKGSTLTLSSAHREDSGNYTCSPYNIRAASVLVHVLSEGNSAAAVQNEQDKNQMSQNQQQQSRAAHAASATERTPPSAAVHSAAAQRVIVIPTLLLWTTTTAIAMSATAVFLSDQKVFRGPITTRR